MEVFYGKFLQKLLVKFSTEAFQFSQTVSMEVFYGRFRKRKKNHVRKRAKKPKSLARNSSFFTHYKLVWLGFLKLSPGAQSCRLEVEKKTKGSWASSLDLLT